MKHLFFIDPIEKLNIKKDSSLYLAKSLEDLGQEVYLLFPDDLYFSPSMDSLAAHSFILDRLDDYYFSSIKLEGKKEIPLEEITIHMRIDPPFDTKYLGFLWILEMIKKRGAKVLNDPVGIMKFNEKLMFTQFSIDQYPSFFGMNLKKFKEFYSQMRERSYESLIFKPMNLFSGIGIEKKLIADENLESFYQSYSEKYQGQIVIQPFIEEVYKGEIRAFYYKSELIGSILKLPQEDSFLSNIAQGAEFRKVDIDEKLQEDLRKVTDHLVLDGVDLVAFDILGGKINEVNVTCPGLLNEISKAYGENIALKIAKGLI